MSAEVWLTLGMFVLGVPGVYFGVRAVRSATKADQQRAHDALNVKLDKAREAERELCRLHYEPQISHLQGQVEAVNRDLVEMTGSRDYYRGKADTLQETLNARGRT